MKNVLMTFSGILLASTCSYAQVKIGGNATPPPASAVLELDGGNSKGLLLPRMRKIDIDAIQNPAEGLTIYATDEQAVYLRKSLVWEKQAPFSLPYSGTHSENNVAAFRVTNNGDFTSVAISGVTGGGRAVAGSASLSLGYGVAGYASHVDALGGFFTNTQDGTALVAWHGKTGIGTSTPSALLHINGQYQPGNTIIIDDDDDPIIQFRKAGINKSYIKQLGNDLVFSPNGANVFGKLVLQSYNDGGWMFIDAAGNVSAGISPNGFQSNIYNSRMNIVSADDQPTLTLLSTTTLSGGPTLRFMSAAVPDFEIGSILCNGYGLVMNSYISTTFQNLQGTHTWKKKGEGSMMDLTNMEPNVGKLYVSGRVDVGKVNNSNIGQAALNVWVNNNMGGEAISVNAVDPIIRLKNNSIEKGFIQLVGDDLKVGTLATNDLGNFVIRTNGSDRIVVRPDGKMVLGSLTGTAPATNHLLAVKGRIAATEFTVTALAAWPDYVFDDSYRLTSLEETEAYIKANKHLPNMPAAAVIEKDGYGLAEMQKRMMEKIEELTLHLIEANKEIQLLKVQLAERK